MLSYNKNLKQLSRTLRRNTIDEEKLLWSKMRGRQLKGLQFYRTVMEEKKKTILMLLWKQYGDNDN